MNLPPIVDVDQIVAIRFLKFSGIGVAAFLIDVIVFQGVLSLSTASLYLARLISFVVATTAAWLLNRTFTFRDATGTRPLLQWARFFGANLVGGSVNYAVFVLAIAMVPLAAAFPVLALAAGSVSGVAFNFTAYQRYVFRADTASSRPV
jgi:putative flippase GtrA